MYLAGPDIQPASQGFHLFYAQNPRLNPCHMDSPINLINYAFYKMSLKKTPMLQDDDDIQPQEQKKQAQFLRG
jgi:hypothetical protein